MNRCGDLICPHCRTRWITPAAYFVKAGSASCLRCGKTYVVTEGAAGQANTRQALLMAGVPISQLPGED